MKTDLWVCLCVCVGRSIEYNISYVYHALYAYFDRDNVALPGLARYGLSRGISGCRMSFSCPCIHSPPLPCCEVSVVSRCAC